MAKTIREASLDLGLTRNTIRGYIKQGILVARKEERDYGATYLIEQEEIDKFRKEYHRHNPTKRGLQKRVFSKGDDKGSGRAGKQALAREEVKEFYERLLSVTEKQYEARVEDLKGELDRLQGLLALPPGKPGAGRQPLIAGLLVMALALAGFVWAIWSFIR